MPATMTNNEVHVWTVLIGGGPYPQLIDKCRTLLPSHEIHRSERFFFERDRHQFLFSHAFLRFVLSEYADVAPVEWRFVHNEYGKPRLTGGFQSLCFNMTHTAGLVACAVSLDHHVGVDAEYIERTIDLDIAGTAFSSNEIEYLEQTPLAMKREVFFEIWTVKEAYIKARGQGLTIPLKSFAVQLRTGEPPTISFLDGCSGDPHTWQFYQIRPSPCHQLAVCVCSQSPCRLQVRQVTPAVLLDPRP
jgi:4'-phosphopantetheinyl transferase